MDKNNRVIYGIAGDGEIMRVVICDDEKVTCSEIEKMLSFFAFEKCIKLEVDVFFYWFYQKIKWLVLKQF